MYGDPHTLRQDHTCHAGPCWACGPARCQPARSTRSNNKNMPHATCHVRGSDGTAGEHPCISEHHHWQQWRWRWRCQPPSVAWRSALWLTQTTPRCMRAMPRRGYELLAPSDGGHRYIRAPLLHGCFACVTAGPHPSSVACAQTSAWRASYRRPTLARVPRAGWRPLPSAAWWAPQATLRRRSSAASSTR